jgi:enoyl-CoA hydratase/carnithine racemase
MSDAAATTAATNEFTVEDRIRVTLTDGVADVRMIRTDKMNALDDAMFQALVDTGERLKTLPGLRAVVLSGEGRAFCAGLDMGNFSKMASGERKGGDGLVEVPRTPAGANRAQQAAYVCARSPFR